jgi:hypothetical protein
MVEPPGSQAEAERLRALVQVAISVAEREGGTVGRYLPPEGKHVDADEPLEADDEP